MNLSKKLLLSVVLSSATLNLVAVESESKAKKDSSKEQTEQSVPAGFSFKKYTTLASLAAATAIWITYMQWSSTPISEKADTIETILKSPAFKKWVEIAPVAVFAVDVYRDYLKTWRGWCFEQSEAFAGWLDQQCGLAA